MAVGRIVRAIAGFYYVESLESNAIIVESSIRGKIKLSSDSVFVGDKVEFFIDDNGKGVITKILPRENQLLRPYIANVDLIVLVFAHHTPDPNEYLMTKFLVLAENSNIPYLLVFNKLDLVEKRKANLLAQTYRNYGYEVLCTSVVTHQGKRKLQQFLKGKTTVFAGPSGVGKSALLNMVCPGFRLQTGAVSEKIGRGKHTTREVQLLKVNANSYVADTPGFSQINLDFIEPQALAGLFPDFDQYLDQCKFSSCVHQAEPGCAVKKAVDEGKLSSSRYQYYLELLNELKLAWKNRYR